MSVVSITTSGTLPLWIDGKAVAAIGTRTGNITNPATGEVIRKAPIRITSYNVCYTKLLRI